MTTLPVDLRARLAADYTPVRPLAAPWARAMWCAPFALLALVAAPVYFSVRADAAQLGWFAWGASLVQAALGLAVIAAALRESVPGRSWSRIAVLLWITTPVLLVIGITMASWELSPFVLRGRYWLVWLMCLSGSAASALPVVALATILATRAFPTRPVLAGALVGLGAGLLADAGWRMFCHFSEPAHVLPAHLGGVMVSMMAGIILARMLRPGTPVR